MTTITVHLPVAEALPDRPPVAAPRTPLGPGSLVRLVANGKPKADVLLDLVADALAETFGDLQVDTYRKASAAVPLTDEEAAAVADGADLAIAAIGDCGACSSCSVEDAARIERLGVPATVVITEPFQALAARFAVRTGVPHLDVAVVPHPVASRDGATLRRYAATVADQVASSLRVPERASP